MNNKSSFLILNISDNKIIFHAANNWGQFKLPGDYKELYLYIELINTIKTVKQTKDTKCLFAFAFNDKYLSGNFNVTVFMNADGNITILLSKNENPSLHSQIKEMRDSFTASIGHELKTPLTSILSMIELMKLTELTPKQNDYLKFLDTSSLQLTSIINDILDFNKLETNNIQLEHKQTNLRRCIDDAVTIVAADFALIPLEYIVSIPSGIPIDVYGDQSKIIQILINLIKNSAKFSPNNGKILINLNIENISEKKKKYIIDVIDYGIGISPEDFNKLFVPYTQLNKDESRRRYGGTGLGLVISKKLCNLMGGDILVESEVGKGTKMSFSLILDVINGRLHSLSVSNEMINLMKDKNILIVDDTEVHRITLMQMATNWGANCLTCCSGSEALALLEMRTHQKSTSRGSPSLSAAKLIGFNLAIVDYCMPNMNGRDLAIEIKKRGFDFPIVILSSLADNVTGPFHLSFKPINKLSLEDIIKSIFSPTSNTKTMINNKINDKILIVDDCEGIRFGISESLRYLGYVNIDNATNGDDAINYVNKSIQENTHYKYIFMDIIMPVKGGVECVLEINKLYKDFMSKRPYIIALTATSLTDEHKYMLPDNGAMNAFMAKPLSIEKLKNIMILK